MDSRSRKIIAALSVLLVIALAVILALVIRGGGDGEAVNASSAGATQTKSVANTVKATTTSTVAQPVNNSSTTSQSAPSSQSSSDTANGALPTAVGESSITTIVEIGSRLVGAPDSGTAIKYANGGYQVSYDVSASTSDWLVGDQVRLYLKSLPANCPPGDNRGKLYRATNLRTNETWEAYDSQHMCGGA